MSAVVVIKGGTVIDASGSRRADVLVEDGLIRAVADHVDAAAGATVLDADGAIVSPGFVDLHTHLREPGGEDAETIETGARAGALGGYTALVAMPNTNPPIDTAAVVEQVLRVGREAPCDVYSSGCITKGRAGEELAPLGELHGLGVRIFTDDGACVADAGLMRRALEYARALPGAVLAQHCEDPQLARGGHMHEGAWSSWLGIPGMPAEAESVVVARDIALAGLTGGRVHFLHLSTAASVDLVRAAKAKGLAVTAEAAPHHFTLTDSLCCGYDPLFKVNPPLRTDGDVKAVKEGLADGTIDAIATDHAPHHFDEKNVEFDLAPFGVIGLESAFPVCYDRLVRAGVIDLDRLIDLMSCGPARIFNLPGGTLRNGTPGDVTLLDLDAEVTFRAPFASKASNSAFIGQTLRGRAVTTIVGGAIRYDIRTPKKKTKR